MRRFEVIAGAVMLGVGILYAFAIFLTLWSDPSRLTSAIIFRGAIISLLIDLPIAWALSALGSAVIVDGLWRGRSNDGY